MESHPAWGAWIEIEKCTVTSIVAGQGLLHLPCGYFTQLPFSLFAPRAREAGRTKHGYISRL